MTQNLRTLAYEITGKRVVVVGVGEYYHIGLEHLEIPGGRGKKEQVVHEVLHWIVAEDWQRSHEHNLGYGHSMDGYEGRDPRCTKHMMERQELMTCHLQRMLYQMAGKPFPKGNSCSFRGRTRALADEEVAWLTRRASEACWTLLVSLARSRW